ncbi:MAG: bifunctional alpha,alpha-trehalose-phosphate synthase (UDP-forming)/trehalose-phosphatase [Anaerolineales bacterium]|jgi:trehalose 6-phosphate synthase/phosphatase
MDGNNNVPERLIVVSNRLPVTVKRENGGFAYTPSVGGLATTLNALRDEMEMIWIGTPGINVDSTEDFKQIATDLQEKFDSVPLQLSVDQFDKYYLGFSNGCIWPLFHYFPQYAHYDYEEWESYRTVNERFCEKVLEHAGPNDTIWVHDYHLTLLPALIRAKLPEAIIGYFLHIPFPSYEIFRTLPWREEILRGMLGADLVGFHSYGYARHFLSSILRILGLDADFGRVNLGDRTARVDTFPLGVDVEHFASAKDIPEVQEELENLRSQVEDKKVILSVDRLDFTKGIIERMLAFERFLNTHEEWLGKVSLITLLVPSRTQVPEYQQLKKQVDETIGRINGEFGLPGWTPITYLYRFLPFERLAPLYLLADVALVTPLRDGMNLVAKEYIAARTDDTGVLILSETAGAAAEMGEAVIVNPHDEEMIVQAIDQALNMPREEQVVRNKAMRARLKRYDTKRWAADFITQMESLRDIRRFNLPRRLRDGLRESLLKAYREAERRLLLLDYDGTLVPFAPTPEAAKPDEELLSILSDLKAKSRNRVVVISGRDAETLESWLGSASIDLVAEHGARYRKNDDGEWKEAEEITVGNWKEELRPVFDVFVDRTPGALLEEKGHALVWHYRRAEPGLGSQRAAELTETLEGYVANTSLHILQGHKVVEVKPSMVSKGRAAQPWLHQKPGYDFILAVGDDVTDEALFEALPEHGWSVKVGFPERSKARFFVSAPEEVRQLLKDLKTAD